jgi:hypothetical protein
MAAGLRKAGHVSILLSWISALAALPGVSLGAWTCIFEVPGSNTSWDVVRVSKRG